MQAWFGGDDKDAFDGCPVNGIWYRFSEFTPFNVHFRGLIEHITRGVLDAGGVPLEFPVFSCDERNLASMDVGEAIRGNPIDGVVLMAGCDKTTPSLPMGTASCKLPHIVVSGGPVLNGRFQGRAIGSGTVVRRFFEDVRGGRTSREDFMAAEAGMSRSAGHCMTMGTASTMAGMAAALGVALPEAASGYTSLYTRTVMQAERGADLGFLVAQRGHAVPGESHRVPRGTYRSTERDGLSALHPSGGIRSLSR